MAEISKTKQRKSKQLNRSSAGVEEDVPEPTEEASNKLAGALLDDDDDLASGIPAPFTLSEDFGETSTDKLETVADIVDEAEQNGESDQNVALSTSSDPALHADTPTHQCETVDEEAQHIATSNTEQLEAHKDDSPVLLDELAAAVEPENSQPITEHAVTDNSAISAEPEHEVLAVPETEQTRIGTRSPVELQPLSTANLRCFAHNQSLESVDELQRECIHTFMRRGSGSEHDPLGDLLAKFLGAFALVRECRSRVEQHVATCATRTEAVWTFNRQTIQLEGVCIDSARVTRRVDLETAHFNEAALRSLGEALGAARQELLDAFVTAAIDALAARAAIDMHMEELYVACPTLRSIPDSLDVQVFDTNEVSVQLRAEVNAMLRAIGTLMAFLRRPRLRSATEVYSEVKRWLLRLCATVLRAATVRDHLVLLIELAHLPNGMVADWAVILFQPLVDAYTSVGTTTLGGENALDFDRKMDLFVAALTLLCNAFPEREKLPKLDESDYGEGASTASTRQLPVSSAVAGAVASANEVRLAENQDVDGSVDGMASSWCVVDNDGNAVEPALLHSVLGEPDLIALFSQMPIYDLFKRIIGVQLNNEHELYDPGQQEARTISHRMLQALAIYSDLFAALDRGVRLYVSVGYRRVCDLLSKVTLLAVRTLTRHWLVCRTALADAVQTLPDDARQVLLQRGLQMQLEFERQFVLAAGALMCARKLVGWKRLRKLQFEAVSRRANDRLLCTLLQCDLNDQSDCTTISTFLNQLIQRALDVGNNDVRYCLATFSSALVARSPRCSACYSRSIAAALEYSEQRDDYNSDSLLRHVAIAMLQTAFELSASVPASQTEILGLALVNAFAPLAQRYPILLNAAFERLFAIVTQLEEPDGNYEAVDARDVAYEFDFESLSLPATLQKEAQSELLVRFARDAPWNIWVVNSLELRNIEKWLLAPLDSLRQRLVQLILERINLDEAQSESPTCHSSSIDSTVPISRYFLSRSVHHRLCSLILCATTHHLGASLTQETSSAAISASVTSGMVRWVLQSNYQLLAAATQQALSNLVTFLHRQKFSQHTLIQQFSFFLWTVLLRLKLHPALDHRLTLISACNDTNADVQRQIEFDMEVLRDVPELREPVEHTPFHAYAKLMLCGAANSVKQFGTVGLDALQQLLDAYCHMPVLHILFIVVQHLNEPLLSPANAQSTQSDCDSALEHLLQNERFRSQMLTLVNADQTLWTYYKEMLKIQQTQFPGPIITLWSNMLKAQLLAQAPDLDASASASAQSKPQLKRLVNFWTRLLVSLSSDSCDWFRNKPVIYLLNSLAELAFHLQVDDTMLQTLYTEYTQYLVSHQRRESDKGSPKNSGGLIGVLQRLARPFSGTTSVWPSFLDAFVKMSCRTDEYAYIIRLFILVATRYEDEIGIWPRFEQELYSVPESADSPSRADLNVLLGRVLNAMQLNVTALTVDRLSIFRWIEYLLGHFAHDHALYSLFWLHFFERLFRLRCAHSLFRTVQYSTALQKSLRRLLECARDLFAERLRTFAASGLADSECELTARLTRLFEALVFWIDEPRLLELQTNADYDALPDAYFPALLARIRHATFAPAASFASDYVDFDACVRDLRHSAQLWLSVATRMRAADNQDAPAAANELPRIEPALDQPTTCCDALDVRLAAVRLVEALGKTHKRYRRPPALTDASTPGRAASNCFSPTEADVLANLQRLLQSRDVQIVVALVENALDTLTVQARGFLHATASARTRDETFLRDLRTLYKNDQLSQRFALTCRTTCRGPAIVTQPVATKVKQDAVSAALDENRAATNRFRRVLLDCLAARADATDADTQLNVHVICAKTLFVDKLVDWLTNSARFLASANDDEHAAAYAFVLQIGTQLFYRFLKLLADDGELSAFAPTRQFVDRTVSALGGQFISTNEREASNLLRSMLDCTSESLPLVGVQPQPSTRPKRKDDAEAVAERNRLKLEVCSRLAPYFVPSFSSPTFLPLFKQVNALEVDKLDCPLEILFVLLTKFEVRNWLAQDVRVLPINDRVDALRCVMDSILRCGGTRIRDARRTVFDLHARHFQTLVASLCALDASLTLRIIMEELPRRSLPPCCFETFCTEFRSVLLTPDGDCVLATGALEQLLGWLGQSLTALRLNVHAQSTPNDADARVCSNNRFLLLLEPHLDCLMNLLRFLFEHLWIKLSIALRQQHIGTFEGVGLFWSLLDLAFKPFLAPLPVPLSPVETLALRRGSADAGAPRATAQHVKCQLPLLVCVSLAELEEGAASERKTKRKESTATGIAAQSNQLLGRYAFILGHFRSLIELLIHDIVGHALSDAKAIDASVASNLEQSTVASTVHQLTQLTWAHYLTFSNDMHSLLRSLVTVGGGTSTSTSTLHHSASVGDIGSLNAAACVLPTMNALFNLYHTHFLARFNWEVMRVDLTNLRCLIVFHETWSAPPPIGANPSDYAALASAVLRFAHGFILKWNWLAFFRDLLRDAATASRRTTLAADGEPQLSAMRTQLVDSALQLLVAYACSASQLASEKEGAALLDIFLKFAAECAPLVDSHSFRALLTVYGAALLHTNPSRGDNRSLLHAAACDRFATRTRVTIALRAAAGFDQLRRARPSVDTLLLEFATASGALDKCALFLRMNFDALNSESAAQFVASLCAPQSARDSKATNALTATTVRDCQSHVRQLFADLESIVPSVGLAHLMFDESPKTPTVGRKPCHTHVVELAQTLVDFIAQSRYSLQPASAQSSATAAASPSPAFLLSTVLECVNECNSHELLVGVVYCAARSLANRHSHPSSAATTVSTDQAERARRHGLCQLLETTVTRYFNLAYEADAIAFRRLVSHLNVLRFVPAIVDELLAANSLTVLYCLVYGAFVQELLQKNDTRRALSCLLDLLSSKLRTRTEVDERRVLLFWFQVLFTLADDVRTCEPIGAAETVQPACADLLNAFCAVLLNTEENSASTTGWFSSAKENAKKNILSSRFRILLRCLYTFIVAQMPTEQSIRVCAPRSSSSAAAALTQAANTHTNGANAQPARITAALRQLETMRDSRQFANYRDVLNEALDRIRDPRFTFPRTCEFLKHIIDRLVFADTFKCIDRYESFMRT